MTLREPPKTKQSGSVLGRFLGLLIMLAIFAVVIWSVATNQQAAAIERSDPRFDLPGTHVPVAGHILHIQEFGDGPSVLLIHDDSVIGGVGLTPLAEALADGGKHAVLVDLPGFGFSDRPDQPGRDLTATGMAGILADLIDERGLGPVHLVGLGWGGEIAAELAVTQPDLVARLDLVDTTAIPASTEGRHTLSGLPLGLGQAFAFTFDGAGVRAELRFATECPVGVDCNPDTLFLYRRAAEVPGTSRAIWARRASDPAALAPTRLDQITLPTRILAVDAEAAEMADLARQLGGAPVLTVDRGGLAEAILETD